MKAVIMAGGEGTRLRPLTCGIPKPMVPILNRPVMEHIINLLKKHGISDIAATLWYMPQAITEYFGDGEGFGANLNYYIEQSPLGTGGSVLNAGDFLDDTFIVISGDALTDIDINSALEFHRAKGSKATLVLRREPIPLEYGIVITDEENRISKFLEKPSWGEVFSDTINTGIYILEPEVLGYYKKGDNFDFSKDLFPRLLRDNVPMYGYISSSYWCDIGDLGSYRQTHFDILEGMVSTDSDYDKTRGIYLGKGTLISSGAIIKPPVYIGKNCIVKSGSVIDSYTIIGDNCEIGENTTLKKSILWNNVRLGRNVQCRGTIICSKVNASHGVNLYEDSVIGSECIIFNNATVRPDIKIWPGKTIKEDTIINKNLIWGTKASKILFGRRDISGQINIEITPEFASLLGSAFSSIIKKDWPIVVSSDNKSASKVIKEAVITGILSTGARVLSIEDAIIPTSRFAVRFNRASGGIHVSMDGSEDNRVHIEFINEAGGNIDRKTEKKIENLFIREDFERCNAAMINIPVKVENFSQLYIQNALTFIKNIAKIKGSGFKVIISSPGDNTLALASRLLEYIGCSVVIDYSVKNHNSLKDHIISISETVRLGSMDMGVIFSENGENIILIDDKGLVIESDRYTVLTSLIALKSGGVKKLVVPYTTTMIIDRIAEKYNAAVIRTKSAFSDAINATLGMIESDSTSMLQYILNFDGIYAAAKILDFLAENSLHLSQLSKEIPDFHTRKAEVSCDFKDRGRIIRKLIEENKGKMVELYDGIKINTDKGWTLVIPDNEKSIFNIYTEGFSEEYADELSGIINDKINKLLREE